MLKISHLSKSFQNQPILKDITFSIEKGGTTGISGKNGAGKTTLLRIIAGIVSPDGGDILLDEKPLLKKNNHELRRKLLYLGHSPNMYPGLSGEENLQFVMSLYGASNSVMDIDTALSTVELKQHKWKLIRNYSRGMLQRLVLAKALVTPWELLLLDEPMAGLDEPGVVLLQQFIEKWQHEEKTLLMVSHQKLWLEKYCPQILHLENGIIQFNGENKNIRNG